MEGWKSGKIENGAKIEKLENRKDFNFFFFLVVSGKVEVWKKVSLYKFTHIPLLKNDVKLKQKSDKQPKKRNHPIY